MSYHEIIATHIRDSVIDRGIEDVLHFTQLKNLPTILKYGLMSYTECDKLTEDVFASDPDRYCDASVSVTASTFYPKMFESKRRKEPGTWVILALDPRLLWDLECHFFPMNLGTREMKWLSESRRKTNNGFAFDSMFEDCAPCGVQNGKGYRDKIGLPYSLTTRPDAEIQVMSTIPAEWIRGAWVEDEKNVPEIDAMLKDLPGEERDVLFQSFDARYCFGGKKWG